MCQELCPQSGVHPSLGRYPPNNRLASPRLRDFWWHLPWVWKPLYILQETEPSSGSSLLQITTRSRWVRSWWIWQRETRSTPRPLKTQPTTTGSTCCLDTRYNDSAWRQFGGMLIGPFTLNKILKFCLDYLIGQLSSFLPPPYHRQALSMLYLKIAQSGSFRIISFILLHVAWCRVHLLWADRAAFHYYK